MVEMKKNRFRNNRPCPTISEIVDELYGDEKHSYTINIKDKTILIMTISDYENNYRETVRKIQNQEMEEKFLKQKEQDGNLEK